MLVNLPSEFLRRMKEMLGSEFSDYEESLEDSPFRGIRLNPLKCKIGTLEAGLPFSLRPAPFSPLEYYIPDDVKKLGNQPLHHAGAFYVQEPSASSSVTVLDPKPGEKVLDLCAAPGGKSTQIASLLAGKGILWSNEIVRNRASILYSNLERLGVRNAVVSSCHPEALCHAMEGYFDRVLVDAPCSGEGMFRRSEEAVRDWSPEHVRACAERQSAILESASASLREGGILVYSTCTFSKEEDEGVVSDFLKRHEDFQLEDCGVSFGRSAFLPKARRIFPMDGGEGHFVAKLRKYSSARCSISEAANVTNPETEQVQTLLKSIFKTQPSGMIRKYRLGFYLMPEDFPEIGGLNILSAGVMAAEARKGRIEPVHAIFQASSAKDLKNVISFAHDSPEIRKFLHGEELQAPAGVTGWCGISVDGIMTGFGKSSCGRIKNHYPKGLRIL